MLRTIGVLLCGCGPNIKEAVDLQRLSALVSSWPGVAWAAIENLPCSENERPGVLQRLKENPVDALVVAGCSPKEREATFQEILRQAGMNPYLLQFANIREHCAWVVTDKEGATKKAESQIRAAVERARWLQPLVKSEVPVRADALVLGAGVAGMQSALLMAQEGRQVHLVERSFSIGGRVARLDELAPTMECASCAIEPLMDEVLHHPNIHLLTSSELVGLSGFCGNFKAVVRRRPRGVKVEACIGCGLCLEPCPVNVPDDVNDGLSERKAMHNAYTGALPNAPLIDAAACLRSKGVACDLCAKACPFLAVDLEEKGEDLPLEVGAVVVAVGMGEAKKKAKGPRLMTAQTFERVLNPSGPTGGELRLADGSGVKSLLLVVEDDGSAACRLNRWFAAKYVRQALHHKARVEVLLHADASTNGEPQGMSGFEGATQARRVDLSTELKLDATKGEVRWMGERCMQASHADVLVWIQPMGGAPEGEALAALLGLEWGKDGYLHAARPILDEVSTRVRGVFVTGSASSPRTISEALTHGAAAAGRVLSALRPGASLDLDPRVAKLDKDLCSGCGTCVMVCPYHALQRGGGWARLA
jgi:heterodisulfide reductase subunit A